MMYRHLGLLRMKGDTPLEREKRSLRVKEAIESMQGQSPTIRSLWVGMNSSDLPNAYDLVVMLEFDDQAAFQAHLRHPARLAASTVVKEAIVEDARIDAWE